mmetsp:Transcript_62324/g.200961  ORF Transcript_62324/g.200961 Transcript_62324/m.200961 type:complete len:181 (+) Transcript_62324:1591-2133(+)
MSGEIAFMTFARQLEYLMASSSYMARHLSSVVLVVVMVIVVFVVVVFVVVVLFAVSRLFEPLPLLTLMLTFVLWFELWFVLLQRQLLLLLLLLLLVRVHIAVVRVAALPAESLEARARLTGVAVGAMLCLVLRVSSHSSPRATCAPLEAALGRAVVAVPAEPGRLVVGAAVLGLVDDALA